MSYPYSYYGGPAPPTYAGPGSSYVEPSSSKISFPPANPYTSHAGYAAPWHHNAPSVPVYDPLIARPSGPPPQWVENVPPPRLVWNDPSSSAGGPSAGGCDRVRMSHYPSSGDDTRRAGREYLSSLNTSVSNLNLHSTPQSQSPRQRLNSSPSDPNKPLPRLPAPPELPRRPYSDAIAQVYAGGTPPGPSSPLRDPPRPARPLSESSVEFIGYQMLSSPTFRPPTNVIPRPPPAPVAGSSKSGNSWIPHSHSDLALRPKTKPTAKTKSRSKSRLRSEDLSDFIVPDSADSSSSESNHRSSKLNITDGTPERRRRATSEQPLKAAKATPKRSSATPNGTSSPAAVRCAGFTRKGQPCQRLVKAVAPYLTMLDMNAEGEAKRYCKDHAGMICEVGGFYWRGDGKGGAGVWIDFDEFIPSELSLQTKALIRTTMESPLTDKESPGFLYAYELRDMNTPTTLYYKVGRTDNVPRRIGEWSSRCRHSTPTLRDIFPLASPARVHASGVNLNRQPSAPISFLPGAFRHTTNPSRQCLAVKRWEKLVHLELADRSAASAHGKLELVREKCADCQAVHREVFPIGIGGGRDRGEEYDTVKDVICRWERFVKLITERTA